MEEIFTEIREAVDAFIWRKQVPGISIGIVDGKGIVYRYEKGYAHAPESLSIQKNTIYDLASLTKVTATLPAIMLLWERGILHLEEPVSRYLQGDRWNSITIRDLLHHTSGLPASNPFYLWDAYDREKIITTIENLVPEQAAETHVIYSDLNFILLGFIVEELSGVDLDTFAGEHIFRPMDMAETCFNPPGQLTNRIAATEYRHMAGYYCQGVVHDENARFMKGVSGHAGLFSTLGDMALFAQMILRPERFSLLREDTIHQMIADVVDRHAKRGLGWQFNDGGIVGERFPSTSFGHTGFTGTSIWFDGERNYAVVLLTNRVHYGRECDIGPVRKHLHDLIHDILHK